MCMKIKRLVMAMVTIINTQATYSQSLEGYGGVGIGCDNFLRDKTVVPKASNTPFLFSPQAVCGLRLHPKTNFILMLDATLGTSRIALMSATDDKVIYQQVRSLVTIGSGLYVPLDRDRYFMPFIQLGTGFFDFSGLDTKNYNGAAIDYRTNTWTAVCGAGVEYKSRIFIPSVISFRFLYTPLNIFPEPYKYTVSGLPMQYELQGKLLQFLLTYQVPFSIKNWNKAY